MYIQSSHVEALKICNSDNIVNKFSCKSVT